MVANAIIGMDYIDIEVNGKIYVVKPPTIYKIVGGGKYLSVAENVENLTDVFRVMNNADNLAHALSWLINGNDNLYNEFTKGTFDELVAGVEKIYSLMSIENFIKLSTLAKNVSMMIANPRY